MMNKTYFDRLPNAIKAQFGKPLKALYSYLPMRAEATAYQWSVRRFIWKFKDGDSTAVSFAADVVAKNLLKQYGTELSEMTFVCVPAHSAEANAARYKDFSQMVCALTGMQNGYKFVKVSGEKLAIHECKKGEKSFTSTRVIEFSKKGLNGAKVLLFDDIITKGMTYAKFAATVEEIGAAVVGAVFLARTLAC